MTYADTHGRADDGPVNWVLHREWVLARETHPSRVRRAETTDTAVEDLGAPSNQLRLALGVAAGALLVAGSFVASSFSGTGESANSADPVARQAFTSLEQRLSVTEPVADAPAPAPPPVQEQPPQEAAPPPAQPPAEPVATHDPATDGGEPQPTAPSAHTPAPPPAPAQHEQWGSGQWGSGQWGSGQWGYGTQWDQGSQWGSGAQWGYGQWGYGTQQWSPVSGFGAPTQSSYSAAASTPSGPAMSMLDPFCDLAGR